MWRNGSGAGNRKDTDLSEIAIPRKVTDSWRDLGQIIHSPCLTFPKFPRLSQGRRFVEMAYQYFSPIFTRTEELGILLLLSSVLTEHPRNTLFFTWNTPQLHIPHSPFSPPDQSLSIASVQLDNLFFHAPVASHAPSLPIQMGKTNRILMPGDPGGSHIRCAFSQITPQGILLQNWMRDTVT